MDREPGLDSVTSGEGFAVPDNQYGKSLTERERPLIITSVETVILDIPTKRPHRFSVLEITSQPCLFVFIRTEAGLEGVGESTAPGGPWWSGHSVESMQATIDGYIAPFLIGKDLRFFNSIRASMDKIVHGSQWAKCGVETAMLDIITRDLDIAMHRFFGGAVREALPLVWPLASGKLDTDIAEAQQLIGDGIAKQFKVKMGAVNAADDVEHIAELSKALGDKVKLFIDLNSAWNTNHAREWLPRLVEAGVDVIEQPVERWNLDAHAELVRALPVPIMVDESVSTPQDVLQVINHRAATVIALKPMKHGGPWSTLQIGQMAGSAGLACFGGTFLETGLGAAASLQAFCTLSSCTFGCELVGPRWMADDILEKPLRYESHALHLTEGPGTGVTIDRDKFRTYMRK